MRVLVADDEPLSRHMLERSLRGWGYDVVLARDGLQAMEILSQPDAPKLLVLDWLMPGKDGIDVCRELRKRHEESYIYVLLLTSKRAQNDVIEGLESGADDYLTKPFDLQELRVRLRTGKRIILLMDQLVEAREALRELAMHDALTGLWNRSAILQKLDTELERSRRDKSSVGLIMVDLDNFKSINDTYGHPVGDAVLRETAKVMHNVIRTYDIAGRYGGEEFLVVVPGCNEVTAVSHAERLRKAIGQLVVSTKTQDIQCTASFGVAVTGHDLAIGAHGLIECADDALYSAKRGGRNQVSLAAPLLVAT